MSRSRCGCEAASLCYHPAHRASGAVVPGAAVCREVIQERVRQDAKWGEQNHLDATGPEVRHLAGMLNLDLYRGHQLADAFRRKCGANLPQEDNWRDILLEEVFEALAEDEPDPLRSELVQVAAVAVAWVEAIDRRREPDQ